MIKVGYDFLLVTCYRAIKKSDNTMTTFVENLYLKKNNILCGCFTGIELTKGVDLAIISMDIIQV